MKADSTPNVKTKMTEYFKGVKFEWGKITWPEKAQVQVETVMVIAIVFVFIVIILCMDYIYSSILNLIK